MKEASTPWLPVRCRTETTRPAPRGPDDLAFARGLLLGLALSLLCWAAILCLLVRLL